MQQGQLWLPFVVSGACLGTMHSESPPMGCSASIPPLFMAEDAVTAWLAAAGKIPLLTAAEEIHLATLYQRSLQPDATPGQLRAGRRAKERMIQANLRLVVTVARKFFPRIAGTSLNHEDLLQEGVIGLNRAAEKFDPERGFKFSTYSYWWIQQGIIRSIEFTRDAIRAPTTATAICRRWRYRPEGQTLAEFCEQYGYKPKAVRTELEHAARAQVSSLDMRCKVDDSERSSICDLVAADDTCTLDSVDYADAIEAIRSSCPDALSLVELQAGGMGKGEMAQLLGTSPRCVTQRLRAAREELIANTPTHVAAMMGAKVESPVAVLDRPDYDVSPLPMTVTPSPNGHGEIDKLERLVAEVQQAEPQAEPKPKRQRARRRTKAEMAAARAAASGGTLVMRMADAEIEGSPADLAVLLREMNRAS